MDKYPPGSWGALAEEIKAEARKLPWYLAPYRWWILRRLRKSEERVARGQLEAIRRYLRS